MKKLIILLLASFIFIIAKAQHTDKKLQQQIQSLIQGFHGDIGLYIKNLNNGKTVAIHADSIFSTASIVKIPIMIGIMDKINKGELDYHQQLQYNDSLLYPGVDILGSFKNGENIELGKVMMLMLTMSDNTASIWLQGLAGGGRRINEILDSLGFPITRVNSRTPGREAARAQYGWGQTTPREIATLLEKIYREEVISKAASDKMLRMTSRSYWDAMSISQIPPYATVFAKYGALDQNRNEVVLVRGKNSTYAFCICTKNNKDTSWQNNNEAWVLTRKISSLLWHYFNPKDHWYPAPDADKFY